jgi:hypothetical protein
MKESSYILVALLFVFRSDGADQFLNTLFTVDDLDPEPQFPDFLYLPDLQWPGFRPMPFQFNKDDYPTGKQTKTVRHATHGRSKLPAHATHPFHFLFELPLNILLSIHPTPPDNTHKYRKKGSGESTPSWASTGNGNNGVFYKSYSPLFLLIHPFFLLYSPIPLSVYLLFYLFFLKKNIEK